MVKHLTIILAFLMTFPATYALADSVTVRPQSRDSLIAPIAKALVEEPLSFDSLI